MIYKKITACKKAYIRAAAILSLSLLSCQSYALDAPAALVPAGLSPGDTFFVIFATAGTLDTCLITSTSTDVDNFGIAQALLGAETSTIIGWRSLYAHTDGTNTTAAAEAFGNVIDRPIYRVDTVKVADDRADMFDGDLDNNIDVDQHGANHASDFVFSGFNASGAAPNPLGTGASCQMGYTPSTGLSWAQNGTGSGGALSTYVLSPLLTVPGATAPVAAPTLSEWTLILLALMLGGIGYTAAMKTKQS